MKNVRWSFWCSLFGLLAAGGPAALAQSPGTVPSAVQADMDYVARELVKRDPVPIPILTWPLAGHMMEHSVFDDWVRVTGACSGGLGVHHGWTAERWGMCLAAVERHGASLVFNYSPWHPIGKYLLPSETKRHAAEAFDARFLTETLAIAREFAVVLSRLKSEVPVVVIIDYERYGVTDGEPLTRKLNVIAYAFWGVCPRAQIIWYNQYACPARQDRPKAFRPWLPGVANSGLGYCSLYHGGQFYHHGAIVEATWACARTHGMTGLVAAYSPGSCWGWTGGLFPERYWDYDCPYPLHADWEMGRRITNEWFAKYPARFSPWWKVRYIHVWPTPFSLKVDPADFGRHFLAFIDGLLGRPLEEKR